MPKLWLTEKEQELLVFNESLQAWQKVLYLYLKRHMDYETKVVGVKRKISYKAMAEWCEYRRNPGSHHSDFTPTKSALRHALKLYEDVGLITKLSKNTDKLLVLKFNFAFDEEIRLNEQRHSSDSFSDTSSDTPNNDLTNCNETIKNNGHKIQQHEQQQFDPSSSDTHHISYSKHINKYTSKKEKSKPEPNGFDEFWDKYGRKVGRKKCEPLYVKALAITPHDELLAGVKRYEAHLAANTWKQKKDPAVWLRGEHWNDELNDTANDFDFDSIDPKIWKEI